VARPPRGSHAPGEFWFYNYWGFNALGTIYTRLTRENIFQAFDKRIPRPIGMQDFQPESDGHFYEHPVSLHPTYATFLSA
jgi:CubicO group peptidase (beta-lactamase class C family)